MAHMLKAWAATDNEEMWQPSTLAELLEHARLNEPRHGYLAPPATSLNNVDDDAVVVVDAIRSSWSSLSNWVRALIHYDWARICSGTSRWQRPLHKLLQQHERSATLRSARQLATGLELGQPGVGDLGVSRHERLATLRSARQLATGQQMLAAITQPFSSAHFNRRPELGTGLRATRTIAKDLRIDTGIARTRFNQTLFQRGEMVQDHNTRYGYVVGGELTYLINCEDAPYTHLRQDQRRLRANVSYVRIRQNHHWVLALKAQRTIQPGQELITDDYLEDTSE